MRFAIALALALLVSLNLSAQKNKRPNYKLLWKISGNGLKKPSYLFGTMHVQDKRAFDVNDSVISKITQCEAFAMEVHPDSITQFMASIILDDAKEHETLEGQMTPKEFSHYDSLLKKKTGISLKKFKTVKQAFYFLEQRSVKKDKNTFLDAWLYNIARENGKVMTGLEKIEAQLSLFQENDSTELAQLKKFLDSDADAQLIDNAMGRLFDAYYDGDVEAIYNLVKSMSAEARFKKMIIDRNVGMTDNIVKEIHQHTLFMAVGAGHLGGEPGIVNLLRKKGYTVTPVSAPFSGTASKYKSKGSTGEWYTFTSGDGGYSVEMPQKPIPFDAAGVPVKFQMYLDIGTLTIYMAAHIPLGSVVENQAATKMLDKMVSNMSGSQKVTNIKKITMDGYEGREFETAASGHIFKVKLTVRRTNAYMLMVGPSKESINSPDAKRFLSSLKDVKPTAAGIENFVSKEGGFSVDMPGKVSKQVTNPVDPGSGKPFTVNVFYSVDNSNGSTYILRYNDFPVGYVSLSDSSYIYGTLNGAKEKMTGSDLKTSKIDFRGYPATQFTLFSSDHTARIDGIVALRGERFYMLMSTGTDNEETTRAGKAFFDSFKFTPFEKPSLKEVTFPEGFSLKVPITFESDSAFERPSTGSTRHSFVDRNSGMMFIALIEPFSKYQQLESADKFFSLLKDEYFPKGNVFQKDTSIAGKYPTHEYLFRAKDDNSIVKIRSVIAGMSIVSLWAYLPANDHNLVVPDEIYSSFKVTAKSDWSPFTDKVDILLKDLLSADSTERAEAKSALAERKFKTQDLPKVYKAIKKSYYDDAKRYSIKSLLFEALNETHDKTTQPFIEEIYPALVADSTVLAERALSVLNAIKTRESVRKATDLLMADKSGRKFNGYIIFYPLNDSLQLVNDVIPDLLNSVDKFDDESELYSLIKSAIDSGAFTPDRKTLVISRVMELMTKLADQPLTNKDDYDLSNRKWSAVDLLKSIPFTPQVESIVRKFIEDDSDYNKLSCIGLLLKNNVAVPVKDINWLAEKPTMRLSIYEELSQYKKENLIDKKYTTFRMLAESEVYDALYDDDEYPDKVTFVKEKNVIVDGQKKKILVYTFKYEGVDEVYTAVAGPYPVNAKVFERGEASGSLWEEYKNGKELDEHLTKYLAGFDIKLD